LFGSAWIIWSNRLQTNPRGVEAGIGPVGSRAPAGYRRTLVGLKHPVATATAA